MIKRRTWMSGMVSGACFVVASGGCGGQDAVVLDELDTEASESLSIASFASSTALPPCYREHRGQVYYVQREDALYYCDGRRYRSVELDCDPSWLTKTVSARASACENGGVVIRSGPDRNQNGALESKEVATSGTVCNGADGEDGAPGAAGARGPAGPRGPAGARGPKGESIQGPAGSSCGVIPGDGVYTIECDDGTRVTLRDGVDGADGKDGESGANGLDGTDGANGSVIALYPIPVGDAICANGGVLIATGVDEDRDGYLHASEEGEWSRVCNGAPGAAGADGRDGAPGAVGPQGAPGAAGPAGAAGGECARDDGPLEVDTSGIARWQHAIADATVLVWPDGSLHLNGSQNAVHVTELFAAPFYTASPATLAWNPAIWALPTAPILVGGYEGRSGYRPDGALAWYWDQLGCCDVSSNPPAIDLATGTAYWVNHGPWRVDLRDSPPARVLAQAGGDTFAELSLAGTIGYGTVQFSRWGAVERWDLRTLSSLGFTDVAPGQRLFNAIDARGGIVVTSDGGVVARVAPDGSLDFSAARQASTPPVITGDNRVVYGAGSALEAFSLTGTSVDWTLPTPTPVVDVVVGDCGNIYALLADPPAIYVVDAETGGVRHVLGNVPGTGARQLILDRSTLYAALADRVVALPSVSHGYEPSSPWPVRYHDNQRTSNVLTPY